MLGIDLFNPLNSGLERDKSIVAYDYKSFEPVGGKNLTQNRNNTIKIVSKGVNQHYLPSEAYLDIVFTPSVPNTNYVIVAGQNDTLNVTNDGGATYALATVAAGSYATIVLLNTAFQTAITAAGPAGAEFELTKPANNVNLEITNTAGNGIQAGSNFLQYLGFSINDDIIGIGDTEARFESYNASVMHNNSMALFRSAKLFLNNIEIHSIDYPVFSTTITKNLEYSNNYLKTQGPKEWFFKNDVDEEAEKVRLVGSGFSRRVQIKLSSIFGFLKTYDKCIRGAEIRVELEKNQNFREIVFNYNGTPCTVSITEASLWMPELKGSDDVEAALLDDIVAKKSTVISYENHEVYRQLNTPQSNVSWVLDSLSEVPIFVYVGLQRAERLESDAKNISLGLKDPSLYDNLNLVRAECRVNGKSYPKLPYQISYEDPSPTSVDDYSRLYFEFLRTAMKEDEFDNGSIVDYESFKVNSPFITFNLEREEEIQNKRTENNTIEVYLQFGSVPPGNFYINALVVYQNHIVLSTDGKKYEWSRS